MYSATWMPAAEMPGPVAGISPRLRSVRYLAIVPVDEESWREGEAVPPSAPPPRRPRQSRPLHGAWRLVLAGLCIVLATIGVVEIILPAYQHYRIMQDQDYLAVAGVVAEGVEAHLSENDGIIDTEVTDHIQPVLANDTRFAYARVWSPELAASALVSRLPNVLSPKELGSPPTFAPVQNSLAQDTWVAEIPLLQHLVTTQGAITAQLDEQPQALEVVRNALLARQDLVLKMTVDLVEQHAALQDAVVEMNAVMDALTSNQQDARSTARDASANAESTISLVLEEYRATTEEAILPIAVAQTAPAPSSVVSLLYPVVRGRRVLIPLLIATEHGDSTHVGYAEVVFFDRLGDIISSLLLAALPSFLCLLAAVLVLVLRRKQPGGAEVGSDETPTAPV